MDLEKVLGPALREGHWVAENYEDREQKEIVEELKFGEKREGEVQCFYDTELFSEEEKGYYYASVEDLNNDIKTYYSYVDLSNLIDNDFSNFVIKLTKSNFILTPQEEETF